jgi:hypothetical protein
MTQYKCKRVWARHQLGEIIEHYEWKRLPAEIQTKCFDKIVVSAPVTRVKSKAIPEPQVEVKPAGYSVKTRNTENLTHEG